MRISYKFFLVGSFVFLSVTQLTAQQRVTIFYDSTWAVNSRDRASFYRNTILDTTYLALIGPVKDHYADGTLSMKGFYRAGKKHGEFAFFYPDGSLKVKGKFVNDLPVGTWRFFYENGSAWQTLEFLSNDYKVLAYHDRSGVQKVTRGSGRYEGTIYSYAYGDTLYVDGQVEEGFKDGVWVYYDDDSDIVYREKYSSGKFRYTLQYSKRGVALGKHKKPVGYKQVLPFELIHTERFIYARDVKQSDYPYLDFLPDEDTVYFDQKGEPIEKASAAYFRPTNVINRENPTGYMIDYYVGGQLYREGRFLQGMKDGEHREYHPNGQLAAEGRYKRNQKVGIWQRYYEGGSPRDVIDYEKGQSYVESYWQPDGQLVLNNGNGFFKTDVLEDGNTYRLEGKYLNYQKQGKWVATTGSGRLLFEEEYDEGLLIRGTSYDQYGNVYRYVMERVIPQPKKGMQDFISHIQDNISYPEQFYASFDEKVELEMSFDKHGKLLKASAVKASDSRLSKSVETLARSYGKWQPGKLRGQQKKMTFILPVKLTSVQF